MKDYRGNYQLIINLLFLLLVDFIFGGYFLLDLLFFLDFDGDSDSDSDAEDPDDELEEPEDELDEPEDDEESELESDEEDEELDESDDVELEPDFVLERFDRCGLVDLRGATAGGVLFMRVTTDATDFLIGVSSDMYESSVLDFVCSGDDCLPSFLSAFLVPFF